MLKPNWFHILLSLSQQEQHGYGIMTEVLERTNGNYDEAVKLAFDEAYNRPPSAGEMEIAKGSIAAESDPKEGLRLFIQAMFGANDFLYSH